MKKFILGFITGGIICATATGFAVEYAVTANPFPVAVNGTETAIEGYNINDNTYFKLRDVADAVGGFNVGFSDNTITIDTDTAAEPTPTPTPTPSFTPAQISIVKGDDGYDYTSDGIEVEYVDGVAYIDETDIRYILNDKGATEYSFSTNAIVKFENNKFIKVISDLPRCKTDYRLIRLDFYISTIKPFLDTL